MLRFDSVITALITPFTQDGEVFKEGLRTLVEYQLGRGIRAFFICGTYGLGPAMSVAERRRVTELVMEYVGGRAIVIAHVGSSNIDDVAELIKHAEDAGVHAVASVPPYYYAYDDEAIVAYFSRLVSLTRLPVFAYNNPARTGIRLGSELLKRLAEVGVVGVKDSSFDLVRFYEDLVLMDRGFKFIIGTEALMLPAILAGAETCVSGLSNAFPELVVGLYNTIKERRYEEASRRQLEVIRVRRVLHLVPTIPAVYEVLKMLGVYVGVPKPPLRRLSSREVELVAKELNRLGILGS